MLRHDPPVVSLRRLVLLGVTVLLAAAMASPAMATADPERDTPTNVRAVEAGPDRVTIAFDAAGTATYYHVKVYLPGALAHVKSGLAHDVAPVTVTGLTWGKDYEVVVTAVDHAGAHRYTDSARFSVRTAFPEGCGHPTAPVDVRGVLDDAGRVATIRWGAAEVGCSRLTYRLHAEGVGVVWTNAATLATYDAHLHHLLFGSGVLEPGATYTLTVTATDVRGNVSPPGGPLVVTMPDELAPVELTPPRDLRIEFDGAGEAERFVWEPATGGSGIITYDVEYRFGNEAGFSLFFRVNDPVSDVRTAIGLLEACPPAAHPASQVIFRIVARSAGQASAPSNEAVGCFP